MNQLGFLEEEPSVKKLLYVLRTTTTGIHLLESGALEPNLTNLLSVYGLEDAHVLIERKCLGERIDLEPGLLTEWRPRLDHLFDRLDHAMLTSKVPTDPPNVDEIRGWLLRVRRTRFCQET